MRHLHTIVCAAFALVLLGLPTVDALAKQTPELSEDRFTNSDLMAQPDQVRRIWINGLIVGAAHGLGLRDSEAGACVAGWYFEDADQVYANIIANLERYPDYEPAVVVMALARRACPGIDEVG